MAWESTDAAAALAADPTGPAVPESLPAVAAFRSVGFTLSALGFAVAGGFRERLAPLEIEPREFALLRTIGAAEGLSQHAVGERLRIPASRMVAFIDALEERGLLERRPHPTDRRARALYLTGDGRRLLQRAYAEAVAFESDLCGNLAADDRELLLGLLNTVAATLGLPPGVHGASLVPEAEESDVHGAARGVAAI